jgi:PD-(D/E)XK endonuclease
MHWRRQGDQGELSAIQWLTGKGATVAIPFGHSPDWDLVAELGRRLLRVQVKTSICFRRGRWEASLRTSGGNRSWTGVVKLLDAQRCDYVFVHVGDGRRWFIPAEPLGGMSRLALGGPKYAEFEVEPGWPLPGRTAEESVSTIDPSCARGDVRAAKGVAL